MRAYSLDLRQRVAAACDAGRGSPARVATLFGVSPAWVRRLLQRRRRTGSLAPSPRHGGRKPLLSEAQQRRLRGLVAAHPGATLAQLRARLGVAVSLPGLHRILRRLGISFKKSRSGRPSATAPTWRGRGGPGGGGCGGRGRAGWSSSMRPGPTRP